MSSAQKPLVVTERMLRSYNNNLNTVAKYYGVTKECAKYMYHRAAKSTRKDSTYLHWGLQLQNALVKADRCDNIRWKDIEFGKEQEQLLAHGISVDDMENTTFKWHENPLAEEWKSVDSSKSKNSKRTTEKIFYLLKRRGLIA